MIDMDKVYPIYKQIEIQNLSSPASRNPWLLWIYIALIIIGIVYLTIDTIKSCKYNCYSCYPIKFDILFGVIKAVALVVVLSMIYFGLLSNPDNSKDVDKMKDLALYSYIQKETGINGLECEDKKSCVFSINGEIHSGELKFIKDDRYVILIDKATNKAIQPIESLTNMAH